MKTAKFIITIMLAQVVSMFTVTAQNFIYNGGFEEGDVWGADNSYSPSVPDNTADYVAYWRRADNVIGSMYHSPDWRYMSDGTDFGRDNNIDVEYIPPGTTIQHRYNPAQGNAMMGLGQHELIQQAFNFNALHAAMAAQGSKKLTLRFKIRVPTRNAPYDGTKLSVYFSKNKLRYKEDNEPCDEKFADIGNVYSSYESVYNVDHLVSHFPHWQWHQVEYEFTPPEKMDEYEWIAFNLKSFGENADCGYTQYIHIDDVELRYGCPDRCSRTDGFFESIVASNVVSATSYMRLTNLSNISTVSLKVYTSGGQTVYYNEAYCVNGIDHDIYWTGKSIGNADVADAIYLYEVIATNDCGPMRYTGSLLKSGNYTGPLQANFGQACQNGANLAPQACCPYNLDMYKNREVLIGPGRTEYILANNIWACTATPDFSDEVRIAAGADILFRAGRQITLAEGFNTEPKAVFVAEIVPCEYTTKKGSETGGREQGRSADAVTAVEEKEQMSTASVTVYPNPTAGLCYIRVETQGAVTVPPVYHVYNMVGEKVLSGSIPSGTGTVDLSGFSNGLYIIKVFCGEETIVQKIMNRH
jgi:hypothetical protein